MLFPGIYRWKDSVARAGAEAVRLVSGVIPLLFIVASITVALVQISANPRQAASGIILVLLGLPVYFFWTRKNQPGILANNANH